MGLAALLAFQGAHCLELNFCDETDASCNPSAWVLYLLGAAVQPALCSGGSASGTQFYGFYGGNAVDRARAVCATRDGGYVAVGNAGGDVATLGGRSPVIPYNGNDDPMIVKLDESGSVEWYSFAGAFTNDEFFGVTEAEDGGFVAVGTVTGNIASLNGLSPIIPFQSANDWVVVRFSSVGVIEWYTFLGDTAGSLESAQEVVPTADGGYLITGMGNDLDGMPVAALNAYAGSNFDIVAVKLNSQGVVQWFRYFGSGNNDQGIDLVPTSDGGFVIAGLQLNNLTNVGGLTPILPFVAAQDATVIKIDAHGNLLWHTALGDAGTQSAVAITENSDSSLTVVMDASAAVATLGGIAPLTPYNATDIYVARLTADGAVTWHTFLATAANETAGHVAATPDGGVILTGVAGANIPTLGGQTPLNPHSANQDIFIAKLTSTGSIEWYTFVGGTNNDVGRGLAATRDGGFILSGDTSSNFTSLGSLTPANSFVNADEYFILRGNASGTF